MRGEGESNVALSCLKGHIMLLNSKGTEVIVDKKMNSKSHPLVFTPLREVKCCLPHKHDKMFRLELRAQFKV